MQVDWSERPTAGSPKDVVDKLLQHDPPIALIEWDNGADICAHFLTMEEAEQIAAALRGALEEVVGAEEAAEARSRL